MVKENIDRKWKDLQIDDDERESGDGEVWVIDETDGFGLHFVKKM